CPFKHTQQFFGLRRHSRREKVYTELLPMNIRKKKSKTLGQLDTLAARPVRTSISRTISKTGDKREARDGRKNRLSQWRLRARKRSKGFRARQRIQRR